MTRKPLSNVPASIRQRLLNNAKASNRPFGELLQLYAMERLLYRLSKSAHAGSFVLKGALMLRVWQSPEARPTMDIDMLGRTGSEESAIAAQVREILAVEVEPDGLLWDASSVRTERFSEGASYQGVRVRFTGELDSARVNIRMDIGFGDVIIPRPEVSELPVVLDLPAPKLLCYSRESAIAEKFEAMLKLGELNSRMKDFYDIWLLCRLSEFDGSILAEAVRQTLRRRGASVSDGITPLSEDFAESKQGEWAAFRRRLGGADAPDRFADMVAVVRSFLGPVVDSLRSGAPFILRWIPPGPWV